MTDLDTVPPYGSERWYRQLRRWQRELEAEAVSQRVRYGALLEPDDGLDHERKGEDGH